MSERIDNAYVYVSALPGLPIVRVRRTEQSFPSVTEVVAAFTEVNRALDTLDRSRYGLLVDIRAATGRNDAEFEQTFAPLLAEMERGFSRVAVLVRSITGTLQVQRHAREDGLAAEVRPFTDEAQAVAWLSGP